MCNEKFLIIGSNSFSGASFIKYLLEKNFKVLGVSRSNQLNDVFLPYKWENLIDFKSNDKVYGFNFEKIDINKDLDKLTNKIIQFKPTHIINFAAQGMVAESWENPVDWYKTNVISQVALHDEIRNLIFKKYIHFTTPEVYGSTDGGWIKRKL